MKNRMSNLPSGQEPARDAENKLPSLPARVRTTFGKLVKLSGPIWRAPSNSDGMGETTVSVGLLDAPKIWGKELDMNAPTRPSMFRPELTHLIKVFLAESFEKVSPRGVKNRCRAFHHFERFIFSRLHVSTGDCSFGIEDLTYDFLLSYTDECEKRTAAKGTNPGHVRRFYRWGVVRKIPCFEQAEFLQMRGIRMQSDLRGHIARFRDPLKGAFTWEELAQIDQKISDSEGDDDGRAVASLFRELGLRPEAVVLLRRCHLEILPTPSGLEFFLRVPPVKRRGAVVDPNNCLRRPISKLLGTLLLELNAGRPETPDAPLLPFLSHKNLKSPYNEVWKRLVKWADDVDLVTERIPVAKGGWRDTRFGRNKTPKLARLPVMAYRFRRTIATNLAEQGATQDEIAAFLDDKTTAMAAVYVENSSTVTDLLEATLDRHPEWIRAVELFRGVLSARDDDPLPEILGGVPQLSNYLGFSDIGPIGRCASTTACRLEPPLSCYLCPFFRAAGDTLRHERQLLQIREEIDANIGLESDRMAAVFQLNIAAIVQLLGRIAPSKGAMATILDRIRQTRTRPVNEV